ncbi:MAG: hypothetical protein KGM43_11075 [Planctomycetota bacterium]|nr:hypothetical protein [Planctomycetota bacterium]
MRISVFSLWCALCASRAWEDAPGATTAAMTNMRGAEYPRIDSDLRVTFRIKAADARRVEFDRGKRYAATRSDDGYWTAVTDPQVPGFHYYGVVIDDVMLNDQGSETFYGTSRESSGIEIPEKGVEFCAARGPAQRNPRALVLLEDHPGGAARVRLHPARLRCEPRCALPRASFAARRRGG